MVLKGYRLFPNQLDRVIISTIIDLTGRQIND
jgi:hypothetical protein